MIGVIYVFCLIITYISEYENRFMFFVIYSQYQTNINIKKFFNNFKFPLIISSKGKVKFYNKAFQREILKLDRKKGDESCQKELNSFLKNITNDSTHKSLHNLIKNQQYIDSEDMFTLKHSKEEKLTIHSNILKTFNHEKTIYIFSSNQSENQQNVLIRKIQSMKSYLASVSHDFKTPLSMIIHTSNTLLTFQDIPSEMAKEINLIKDTAEFILFNVQDIMDYSRIENKSLKICP